MAPADKEKTVFRTPWVLFQFKWIPFELHGMAVSFQQLMDQILAPQCLNEGCADANIDIIVIFSGTWEERTLSTPKGSPKGALANGAHYEPTKMCTRKKGDTVLRVHVRARQDKASSQSSGNTKKSWRYDSTSCQGP